MEQTVSSRSTNDHKTNKLTVLPTIPLISVIPFVLLILQVVKDTFYAHAKKAKEEADKIKKEKEEADRRLKEIQQKKDQERMAQDFEPASVTEITDQEAVKIQEDIDQEKKSSE